VREPAVAVALIVGQASALGDVTRSRVLVEVVVDARIASTLEMTCCTGDKLRVSGPVDSGPIGEPKLGSVGKVDDKTCSTLGE
jgi:hypothetical protein